MSYFKYQNKNVFYSEMGKGIPVVFLHGNTASSKMFELLLPLYSDTFNVIMIDFLGHGQSDYVSELPIDIWKDQADQTIALLELLGHEKVHLVGTSGGAFVALNVALKRPDLVGKIIADSFEGRQLEENFAENLILERENAKNNQQARLFYEWCQGENWEHVVDCDTKALVTLAMQKRQLYFKPLEYLTIPMLMIGSKQDDLIHMDIEKEYHEIACMVANVEIFMFDTGGHPAILSNAEKFAKIIHKFLLSD